MLMGTWISFLGALPIAQSPKAGVLQSAYFKSSFRDFSITLHCCFPMLNKKRYSREKGQRRIPGPGCAGDRREEELKTSLES